MNDQSEKYLVDIIIAIGNIETFMIETSLFEDYQDDLKTKSAVERQLIIIGEAVNKLKKIEPELSISGIKEIVLFRNRVVHSYDSIEDSIVWVILKKHIPILKAEVDKFLNK